MHSAQLAEGEGAVQQPSRIGQLAVLSPQRVDGELDEARVSERSENLGHQDAAPSALTHRALVTAQLGITTHRYRARVRPT